MSASSKTRVAGLVLLLALTTAATAAPSGAGSSGDFFGRISRIVKQIGKILRPLEDPTFPKP